MKDKNVAGILALFFGWIGIHRFYLGQVGLGILYALLFWSGISAVLGLIDAIVFFSMDKDAFDMKYNPKYTRSERRRRDTDFDRRQYRRERWDERNESYPREHRPPDRRHVQQRPNAQQQYKPPRPNPFKESGIRKYKEYDYDGAIADFEKALEIEPNDIAVHFNLACAYSLNENTEKSLFHLDRAVQFGFDDFKRIKEHDALAFVRIQPAFDEFEKNRFRLTPVPQPEDVPEDLLNSPVNLLDQLKKLGELRDKGLLTDEEFLSQKKKLLNE